MPEQPSLEQCAIMVAAKLQSLCRDATTLHKQKYGSQTTKTAT